MAVTAEAPPLNLPPTTAFAPEQTAFERFAYGSQTADAAWDEVFGETGMEYMSKRFGDLTPREIEDGLMPVGELIIADTTRVFNCFGGLAVNATYGVRAEIRQGGFFINSGQGTLFDASKLPRKDADEPIKSKSRLRRIFTAAASSVKKFNKVKPPSQGRLFNESAI